MESTPLEIFKRCADVMLRDRDMAYDIHGTSGLTIALNDLRGLFQSKQFYDSLIAKEAISGQYCHSSLPVLVVLRETIW